MNQVPYLGSYGYVAPVTAAPSIFHRILRSPLFWLGILLLFIIGAVTYNSAKKKREEEARSAEEMDRQKDNRTNLPPYL